MSILWRVVPDVLAALSDHQVLALTMWAEARGEAVEGRIAVGCVVRERVRDPRWPDTYREVCLQTWQFSCWNTSDPNHAKLMRLATLFLADFAIRSSTPLDPMLRECLYLAEGVIGGQILDRVGRANHYLTRTLLERHPPAWTAGQVPVARVVGHAFFRL